MLSRWLCSSLLFPPCRRSTTPTGDAALLAELQGGAAGLLPHVEPAIASCTEKGKRGRGETVTMMQ